MVEGLSVLITAQGWLAPLWYMAGFVLAALVPIIPTPLVAALGGTAFGVVPAVVYGLVGMGIGAAVALGLARHIGMPLVRRLVPADTWHEWEVLLGIRSLLMWFVVFLFLNLDLVVMASGMSTLSTRALWATAMMARLPWLLAASWFGDVLLVNDLALLLVALFVAPALWAVNRMRPTLRRLLVRWAGAEAAERLDGPDPDTAPRHDGAGPPRSDR